MRNEAKFEAVWSEAEAKAREAHTAAAPEPMLVAGRNEVFAVPDGPCGFGSVVFPGTSAFGKWALRTGRAKRNYPKGVYVGTNSYSATGRYSQSLARADAAAHAFANVLRLAGFEARPESRMD